MNLIGNLLQNAVQNGVELGHFDPFDRSTQTGVKTFSIIDIGQNMGAAKEGAEGGWYINTDTILPENEQAADYVGTVRHEMGHALGIAAYLSNNDNKKDSYNNTLQRFANEITAKTSWNRHLVDQNLNPAKPGMEIITSNYFNTVIKAANPTAKVSDYFIVDNTSTQAPYDTANPRAGKLYFVGDNVTDALHGATFDGVSGLPVNGWETNEKQPSEPEFSHLQTSGMMSHAAYSNYTSFMEVELAVMQDLGYSIDRKNYFGYSEYGNDQTYINTNGYSARNMDGTAYLANTYNNTPLGIGLHVYGSRNTITQAADILTDGTGAAGIRIDGEANTTTIARDTRVLSDGSKGIGVLVAYGRNQILNQAGTVSAKGDGGIGVRFDLGSSSNGAGDEYRGSYIRYKRDVNDKTGAITGANNLNIVDSNTGATPELNGPLVKTYNVSGSLTGAANAIYIGKNAFVQDINVLQGAVITGKITSDWKHFGTDGSYDGVQGDGSDALKIQYNGINYAYAAYIPDLVTNLNINSDLTYTGKITGADNLKLNVQNGTFSYNGTADVVAVQVSRDASLLGAGTYHVYDYSATIANDFSDANMGRVINHGTIGATTGDVKITGRFISDGTIDVTVKDNGAGVHAIKVTGAADITGSTLGTNGENKPFLNKEYTYLTTTDGITGTISQSPLSDYVLATGGVEGSSAVFTATTGKALAATDGLSANERSVARSFSVAAQDNMARGTNTAQQAANVFYNSASDMKKLMTSAAGSERTHLLGQSALSSLTADSVYSRMDANAFEDTIPVRVPLSSLNGENQTVTSNMPIVLDDTNHMWFTLFRGFETYNGTGGNYDLNNRSFGGIIGYDRAPNLSSRLGGFFSYGKTNYSTDSLNGDSHDWRLGIYGSKRNDDWEYQGLISYGNNHYDLDAYTLDSPIKLNSDFKARVWDVAAKARYTIPSTAVRTWQIKPYGELGYTHTAQDGYTETGDNAFAKTMDSADNNSTRAEIGVEFRRRINKNNSWGGAIGYKRILSGVNPQLNGTFAGSTLPFSLTSDNDRNYLTYHVNVQLAMGGKWTGQAEFRGEKGSNTHKEVYSLAATYHF